MRILGLDPGTATTGFGIIDVLDSQLRHVHHGVIRTPAGRPMGERLLKIHEEIHALLDKYAPDTAAIEKLFFGKNVTTAITVGQARGVLLLALAMAGLEVGEYEPARIKEAITGFGSADKGQMQLMVRHLLDLEETPRPDDAADGLAVAITHYHYHRYASLES